MFENEMRWDKMTTKRGQKNSAYTSNFNGMTCCDRIGVSHHPYYRKITLLIFPLSSALGNCAEFQKHNIQKKYRLIFTLQLQPKECWDPLIWQCELRKELKDMQAIKI